MTRSRAFGHRDVPFDWPSTWRKQSTVAAEPAVESGVLIDAAKESYQLGSQTELIRRLRWS
jgi:hypothetical protein